MKGDKPPCKDKTCGHSEAKHYTKGGGNCIVRECQCKGYKG